MSREILFRGKRENNGEWVYGVPIQCYDGDWQICTDIYKCTVIPETIGQYTGLTDKNGKKIFEGDIVEFYFFDKTKQNTRKMLIEWYETSFYMRELFRNYCLDNETIYDYSGKRKRIYKSNSTYFVEVIGNIHDNPELLEKEN